MSALRHGYVAGPLIGALWLVVVATTVAVAMSFATGGAFRPAILQALVLGALLGAAAILLCSPPSRWPRWRRRCR